MVLQRFEFNVSFYDISLVHRWIYQTLQTITSPVFNEFVFWMLDTGSLMGQMDRNGWTAVNGLLVTIAQRNPNFRVVFKGSYWSFMDGLLTDDGARAFLSEYLLITLLSWVRFEFVVRKQNRFGKLISRTHETIYYRENP